MIVTAFRAAVKGVIESFLGSADPAVADL